MYGIGKKLKVTVNSLVISAQIMQNAWVFSTVTVQSNMLANNQTFTSNRILNIGAGPHEEILNKKHFHVEIPGVVRVGLVKEALTMGMSDAIRPF